MDQGLAELDTLFRIAQAEVQRALGNAERPCGRLDARTFEGLHELLEAFALDLSEKIAAGNLKAVERDSYSFMPR